MKFYTLDPTSTFGKLTSEFHDQYSVRQEQEFSVFDHCNNNVDTFIYDGLTENFEEVDDSTCSENEVTQALSNVSGKVVKNVQKPPNDHEVVTKRNKARRNHTMEFKKKVCKFLVNNTTRSAAEKFGISPGLAATWWKTIENNNSGHLSKSIKTILSAKPPRVKVRSSPKKFKQYPEELRKSILEYEQGHGPKQTCEMFDIPYATLRKWKRQVKVAKNPQLLKKKVFSKEEKKEILEYRESHSLSETSTKFGATIRTLTKWITGR